MLLDAARGMAADLWQKWLSAARDALAPLSASDRVLEVAREAGHLRFTLAHGARREAVGDVPLPREPEDAGPAIRLLMADTPGSYDRLEIVAPRARSLSRTVTLPIAARQNLDDAVRYDLDRLVPFSDGMIHFGVRETGADRATGRLSARLDVAPREEIDPVVAALAAAGLRPDRVRLAADGGPNIAPPAILDPGPVWTRGIAATLAGTIAILGLLALLLPLYQARSALAEAEREAAELRHLAGETRMLRERIATLSARETALVDRKASAPMALDILAAATRAVPQDAYLIHLSVEDGRLAMTGYARRAVAVLDRIEESPLLEDARFSEPVLRDGRIEGERFAISARIARLEAAE